MDSQLLIGLLATITPLIELRLGLPIIINYCLKNNQSIMPYFLIVILLNSFVILIAFIFLDYINHFFLKFKPYRNFFNKRITKMQKKIEKINEKNDFLKYFTLMIFVAIPLPGSGAWSGTLIAWFLGLNRTKSIVAISLGVLFSGLIILFSFLGISSFINYLF